MEAICQELCETEAPTPSYPIVANKVKKNQMPVFDTFGPFPDETLLAGVDRALSLLGPRRVQEFLNLPIPPVESSNSDCSLSVSYVTCPESHKDCRSCSTIIATDAKRKEDIPSCIKVTRTCSCSKCRAATSETTIYSKKQGCCEGTPSRRSSRTSTAHVTICEPPLRRRHPLKRSFSLCSLACRKLKEMLTFPAKESKPKWFWTRLHTTSNGCEIYEIFNNSNGCSHPCECEEKHLPQVIFVVLRNGSIMPFEILPQH